MSRIHTVQITPVIGAAIYVALDAVGAIMEFTKVSSNPAQGIVLQSMVIVDEAKIDAAITLVLFSSSIASAAADHDIMDPTDADLLLCLGSVTMPAANFLTLNDNSIGTLAGINLPLKLSGTSLFGQLQTPGTPTYGDVGALTVTLGFDRG